MLSFTLDTNCIIAVDEARAEAVAVRALAEAHAAGTANVGLCAISASENQKTGGQLENFSEFQRRITSLELAHLELLYPMFYWDVTFFDASLMSDDAMQSLEMQIHEVLFPDVPFLWSDYCHSHGLNPASATLDRNWRNKKCDVQAFWCHTFHKREVFVTTDDKFHAATKKPKLIALAGGRIESPLTAATLLLATTGEGEL